jgi:putative ABC transport system permease protein
VRTVTKAFLRYLPRRRSLSLLQIVGIACGVAAVIGMFFSARAALLSFSKAIEFISGGATHSMERVAGPMEESILSHLMTDTDVVAFSPVIDRRIRLDSGEPMRVLGLDPFLDNPLRPGMFELKGETSGTATDDARQALLAFILDEDACLMDEATASRLRFHPGSIIGTSRGRLRLLAVFPSASPEPLLLFDIGHAQKLFNLPGQVDRVDLILKNEYSFLTRYRDGFRIQSARQKARMYSGMLQAFRLNLEALSLIALFVGVFLIYNTTVFSVISRKRDAGILRSLGASRSEIATAFVIEIFLFGLAGGLLGGVFGYLLSRLLTVLVGQTISNLYFFIRPVPLAWSWWIIVAGALLGCLASLVGSIFPLLDLVRTNPLSTLQGRNLLKRGVVGPGRIAHTGVMVLLIAIGLLILSPLHVYVGFASAFAFLLGSTLLTGLFVAAMNPVVKAVLAFVAGLPGRIAAGNIRQNLGRTAVAVAAFTVALSMSVGLSTMIGSFRESLVWWMGTQLRADLYVGSTSEGVEVPEKLYEQLKTMPGLNGVDPYRNVQMPYKGNSITVAAVDAGVLQRHTHFGWVKGGNSNWESVKQGQIIISESFARNFHLDEGEIIVLKGQKGPATFMIGGVFYDYTTEHGLIMMDRSTYLSVFGDHTINSVGIFIDASNTSRQQLLRQVRERAAAHGVPVFSLRELEERILSVFDSTFAITSSMRMLAIIVAFFGIAGALLTLFMERQRDFGIYRSLGLSTSQVTAMTVMEGLGIGLLSLVGTLPVGTVLALILIKVINLRSFNWTIFYYPTVAPYLAASITALLASVTASLYPVWRVLRTYPYIQMREE